MGGGPRRVMMVVGEASGDLYGSRLVNALRRRDSDLEYFGVGGENLRREGLDAVVDVGRLSGMGLAELLGSIGTIWQAYQTLKRLLHERRPSLLILIDFPEFNLRLARKAKALNIPVLYYVSPQIWAWRPRRIQQIARWVDHMAVVFPFEVPFYQKEGIRVTFVGHPLLDLVIPTRTSSETLKKYALDIGKPTVALLPGSRRREVAYHLPPMLEAARLLAKEKEVQFLVVRASTVEHRQLQSILNASPLPVAFSDGDAYNVLQASDLAWVASGTATLEAALLQRPMIIMYRLAWLTYLLARILVRVDYIGMVNIIAGERVAPELIQKDLRPERILEESLNLLNDSSLCKKTMKKLAQVRERIGPAGATERVADIAAALMA